MAPHTVKGTGTLVSGAVQPLAGVLLLLASMWALSGLDASGKYVMGAGVPLLVLCLVRYVVHLALVLFLLVPRRGWAVVQCSRPGAQAFRGAAMLVATMSFFTTLHYLPQAEATAINFLAPLIVLALAPWVLNEPARVSRWVAAGVGFLGVMLVVRPGAGLDPVGTLFGLLTACVMSAQFIATRRVAVDDPYTTLVWSGGVGSVVLLLALPFYWQDVWATFSQLGPLHWLVLVGTGLWGCLGHLLQILAYRRAPASLLSPFMYFQIVSASTYGWLIWRQFPDGLSWVGIGIVCLSGITIGLIEWRRRNA
ncbi:EamA family transporter [Pusillimonas sp. TS35]|uniref:DMT family transporter n=1 Tax=Paracandidimonas lactea TaxID=2895524 RepID=UPI00136D641F|nr:DMT family transporter [Paracandidimonas lactea]MYN13971.1 EamA family transporter [Pusillimonas sp. TS35]